MTSRLRPAVVETHLSDLFFYGDRVVKVRRPLVQGIADFRSLERRRVSCEREVALNRPLAADVYLGVATIEMGGAPVEHAVVMRRLGKERNLAAMARRGRDLSEEMERLAGALAGFHAGAERSARIDASATGAALWQRWQGVEEALGDCVGTLVDPARYRELTTLALRYVEGREPLFQRRIAGGAACDGHGSLEASDVFCLDDGPRVLDRLEIDEERRYGDALADVAALAQDLELAGAGDAAGVLVAAYGRSSGQDLPPSLVHFYVAQRAHQRLVTACLRHDGGLRTVAPGVLVDQALAHLRAAQPRLVLVGGPEGSGKTALASWVAAQLDATVLAARQGSEGALRRSRAGCERLCAEAAGLLATGRSVVLDARWSAAEDRRLAEDVAHRSAAQVVALRCECPPGERAAAAPAGHPLAEDPWPEALVVQASPGGRATASGRPRRHGEEFLFPAAGPPGPPPAAHAS